MTKVLTSQIWAKRRQQTGALAKATRKRELPEIQLTDAEWQLLREGAELERNLLRDAAELEP